MCAASSPVPRLVCNLFYRFSPQITRKICVSRARRPGFRPPSGYARPPQGGWRKSHHLGICPGSAAGAGQKAKPPPERAAGNKTAVPIPADMFCKAPTPKRKYGTRKKERALQKLDLCQGSQLESVWDTGESLTKGRLLFILPLV